MSKSHRIKSSSGRWAVGDWDDAIGADHWICEQLVELWRQALAVDLAGKAKALARALALAEKIGWDADIEQIAMPMDEAAYARAEADLAKQKKHFLGAAPDAGGRGGLYSSSRRESDWERSLPSLRRRAESGAAARVESRFVSAPRLSWSANPGGATLFESAAASAGLSWAKDCVELRAVLAKARAQAQKLGFKEEPWMAPNFDNLGVGPKDLASSSVEAFDAGAEFSGKRAYAIYADEDGAKGFADKKGVLKNDIAEAALFPTRKAALSFASRYVGDCHAVEVVVSALSYGPLLGSPAPAQDLAAVIAARERAEIEQVLARARVEELEAEIARRRCGIQASPGAVEIAPKSRARL